MPTEKATYFHFHKALWYNDATHQYALFVYNYLSTFIGVMYMYSTSFIICLIQAYIFQFSFFSCRHDSATNTVIYCTMLLEKHPSCKFSPWSIVEILYLMHNRRLRKPMTSVVSLEYCRPSPTVPDKYWIIRLTLYETNNCLIFCWPLPLHVIYLVLL